VHLQNYEKLLLSLSYLSIYLSLCLPACSHGKTQLPLDKFSKNVIFEHFFKICWENSSLINICWRITGALHEDLCTFMVISHWFLVRMINVLVEVVERIKYTFLQLIIFFWKLCHLWDNVEKYSTARQATVDNTIWPRNDATVQTQP